MTETLGNDCTQTEVLNLQVLEVYWIFVGFNKNFMGSVFLGSPSLTAISDII